MGHVRLGNLPKTRKWRDVVGLITAGRDVSQIAAATLEASKKGLQNAARDRGLVYSTLLLTQVTQAAKQSDFISALKQAGLPVSKQVSVTSLVSSFSEAIDKHLRFNKGRTDLGEMAQLSAVEVLSRLCAEQTTSLFDTTTENLKKALHTLSTSKGFSRLSHEFFSRLTYRYLTYFLSRELSNHIGKNQRFTNPQEYAEFEGELELHARQAARIVDEFAGGWYGKANFEGGITHQKVSGFIHVALGKILDELKKGAE